MARIVPRGGAATAASSQLGLESGDSPGAVDSLVAFEIRGDRRGRDVFHVCEVCDGGFVQAEAAEVVAEVEDTAGGETGDCGLQEFDVDGLDVEVAGALGVREGRG